MTKNTKTQRQKLTDAATVVSKNQKSEANNRGAQKAFGAATLLGVREKPDIAIPKIVKYLDTLCQGRLPKAFRSIAAQAACDLNETLAGKYKVRLSDKCLNPLNWI